MLRARDGGLCWRRTDEVPIPGEDLRGRALATRGVESWERWRADCARSVQVIARRGRWVYQLVVFALPALPRTDNTTARRREKSVGVTSHARGCQLHSRAREEERER